MIPRCDHDRIILGCPEPDCEKQNAYLAKQDDAWQQWEERMQREAREIVDLLIAEKSQPFSPTTKSDTTPTPGAE